jgi:hypothetical protein
MQPRTLRLTDPVEALVVEQALALVRQLRAACQTVPHGQVLAQAELLAVTQGRELTRQALQAVLNDAAAPSEKKGRPSAAVPARRSAKVKARRSGSP